MTRQERNGNTTVVGIAIDARSRRTSRPNSAGFALLDGKEFTRQRRQNSALCEFGNVGRPNILQEVRHLVPKVSEKIAELFCEAVEWTHQCWMLHRACFDDNASKSETINKAPHFFQQLRKINTEYTFLQISKLHDRAVIQGSWNISIPYIIEYGDLGNDKTLFRRKADSLQRLYDALKPARMKLIAHNDGEAHLSGKALGTFDPGADGTYFKNLEEFADLVARRWCNQSFCFHDFARVHTEDLFDVLRSAEDVGAQFIGSTS